MRCAELVTIILLFQILFLFNVGLSFGEDQKIQHWSFVPPKPHTPPEVSDKSWLTNEIDNFILLKLEKNGLEPAAEASPHQLIRRVYYDLIGLPPDPDRRGVASLLGKLRGAPVSQSRWAETSRGIRLSNLSLARPVPGNGCFRACAEAANTSIREKLTKTSNIKWASNSLRDAQVGSLVRHGDCSGRPSVPSSTWLRPSTKLSPIPEGEAWGWVPTGRARLASMSSPHPSDRV